jgi:FAD binding domain
MSKPFPVPVWPYLRSGYLKRGRTLDELARECGIDPTGLKRTVGQFNRHARNGEDPEFGRGSTPFNRGSGDPDHKPNPSLAPIAKPLFPGDGELPLAELLGVLPAGASLAVEAPVADLAGRTVGERTRLAHAALTGLLAKANQASDPADAR